MKALQLRAGIGVVILCLLFAGVPAGAQVPATNPAIHEQTPAITTSQRIFSTGHSFHYGLPPVLTEISKAGGFAETEVVGISSIGGSTVIRHWVGKEVTEKLTAGTVDVLMTTPIYLPDEGVENFAQFGFEHNANFRLTMMEFWLPFDQYEPRNYSHGPKGSPTEHLDAPKVVDHNAATMENLRKIHERYFTEMDALAVEINKKLGKPVVSVVPMGQAVLALREKVIAGQAPGLKSQEDLFKDTLGHPKPPMTVMMAYCHFAVIYRKNPVGLPAPKLLEKYPPELNKLLQELAWEAVSHHPLSGVAAE